MQFFEPSTLYDRARRLMKEHRQGKISPEIDSWYEYLERNESDLRGVLRLNLPIANYAANSVMAVRGERAWYQSGKAYYKVFPQMATMMSEVSIDIPADQIQVPYPTFVINLANDPLNDFTEKLPNGEQGPRLKWVMVHEFYVQVQSTMTFLIVQSGKPVDHSVMGRGLFINYEFEGEYHGEPNQYNYTLSLHTMAGNVSDFFEESYERTIGNVTSMFANDEYQPSKAMISRILRLSVATVFFGIDRHEVVMPDLPRKKLEKKLSKHNGNVKAAVNEIREDRSETTAWTIGREISLPRPIVEKEKQDGHHKGLSYSYLRRGHMRYQAYGEGRLKRKLMFIHPHFVKPDLPMAPNRGFKIPDQEVSK